MEILYTVLIAVSVILLGFVVSAFLKKKKVLDSNTVDLTNSIFTLVKIVVVKAVEDAKQKEKLNDIFAAIQSVFNYIYIMSEDLTVEEKKTLTRVQIEQRLRQFQIKIDEEDEILIDIIINTFVDLMPKN